MANVGPLVWYIRDNAPTSTVGWSAVTAWSTGASKAAGALIRQSATPSVGNERVFVAIVAGTTHASTEPTWTVTKGAKTTDNASITWQECTGQPGVNGDLGNTPTWLQNKNTSVSLGHIVQRASAGSLQIVSTAGTTGNGSEPSFSDTAGVTTSDNTVTWTSLGAPSNFTAWMAPHARLTNAYTTNWGAAGHTFYVGDDHAETQSTAISLSNPGTLSSPTYTYSMNHAASFPLGSGNLLAGATATITGGGTFSINGAACYYYGITFAASGSNSGVQSLSGSLLQLDTCAIKKTSTSNNNISFGSSRIDFINTTMQFGSVSDTIQISNARFTWKNTASALAGAIFPTNMFNPSGTGGGIIVCEGVDLSAMSTGKNLILSQSNAGAYDFHFIDCRLGSAVSIENASPIGPIGQRVYVTRSAATGIGYAQHQYAYEGTLDHETTIVRTTGASDGSTGVSWKITTTANSRWVAPFEAIPISIWNTVTGNNVTVTLYGIWGTGAVPNNDDIWMDVEYLGASGSPLASFSTTTKSNNLVTASPLSSDSSTWGGSTTAFKMSVILSTPQPQLAGYIRVHVKAAKVSSTFYIDPLPVLS
jgi:hypothetical protein